MGAPRLVHGGRSVDQSLDKSLQTNGASAPPEQGSNRGIPSKSPVPHGGRRPLHTREVAGSSPAVPITKALLMRIVSARGKPHKNLPNPKREPWH